MDPNKALAWILGCFGLIVLVMVLGYAGVVPFFETPKGDDHQLQPLPSTTPSNPTTPPIPTTSSIPTSPSVPLSSTPSLSPSQSPSPPPVQAPSLVPQPSSPHQSPQPSIPHSKTPNPEIPLPSPRQPRRGLPEIGYYTFDHAEPGALPSGWLIAKGQWQAESDAHPMPGTGTNVLHQSEIPKEKGDAIVLSNDSILKNVQAGANLRISNLRTNQTAGLVFRYQDNDHYYSVGLDTKSQRVVLFKTVAGIARVLAFGTTNRIRANEWNFLQVAATGEHLKVRLNDDDYLSIKDTTFDEGKTGLWTMGSTDAVFDNVEIKRLP